ncbi:hypothetical protein D3C71_1806810 [compost metagenome]
MRPRKGRAALSIIQAACLNVAQRFCALDTDSRFASSTSALTLVLYKVAMESLAMTPEPSNTGPLICAEVSGSASSCGRDQTEGRLPVNTWLA